MTAEPLIRAAKLAPHREGGCELEAWRSKGKPGEAAATRGFPVIQRGELSQSDGVDPDEICVGERQAGGWQASVPAEGYSNVILSGIVAPGLESPGCEPAERGWSSALG